MSVSTPKSWQEDTRLSVIIKNSVNINRMILCTWKKSQPKEGHSIFTNGVLLFPSPVSFPAFFFFCLLFMHNHLCGCDVVTHNIYVWFTEKVNWTGILRDMENFSYTKFYIGHCHHSKRKLYIPLPAFLTWYRFPFFQIQFLTAMKRNGKLITKIKHLILNDLMNKLNFISEDCLTILD